MFTSKKFKGMTEITRKGVLGKVNIPEELLSAVTLDFEIDSANKCINFTRGEEIFVLTDKFGVAEKSDYTLFLVDGGFIINIQYGKVYLQDEDNGMVYSVDDYGDVEYPRADKKINWLTVKDFLSFAEGMVKYYYTLPDNKTLRNYINNLGFGITTEYMNATKAKGSPCFRIRFKDYYTDLGNDEFVFVKYADSEFDENGEGTIDYSSIEEEEEKLSPEDIDVEEGFENMISLDEMEDYDDDDDYNDNDYDY